MTKESIESQKLHELSTFGKIPEYNVLLLGETGVGKSTTVNAWAIYMQYKSFEEAKNGDFELMIPTKFKLPGLDTKKPIEIRYSDGDEKNETFKEVGSPATQWPSAYTFKFKDKVLRIIDTPGFGDNIEGTLNDATIDHMFAYLNNYKELNAIVILVKANQTRTTSFFRHFISELFNYLHNDTSKNLIFCFTFSQNTKFQAGEGYDTVKWFLERCLPEVEFELKSGENCFFIDNNSFRFLTAMKQGYRFDTRQEQSCRLSWDKSAEQNNKMWDRITRKIKPHNLTKTSSLNNDRNFIFQMAEPLVRLQTTIADNIEQIRTQIELLQKETSTKADLEQKLNIEVDSLESELLEHPKTICTDAKCIELIDSGLGNVQINYKTKCHPHCSIIFLGANALGNPFLRDCSAMSSTGLCRVCGCRWDKHQHIKLRFKKVKILAFDEDDKKQIMSAKTDIDCLKAAILVFDDRIKAYQAEHVVIQDICPKFAYILMNNFPKQNNRFCEPYFDLLIGEENSKIQSNSNHPKDRLISLKNMKKTHQEKVEMFNEAMKTRHQRAFNLEDIYEYKKNLLKLKLTGNQLKQMLEIVSLSSEKHKKRIPEKIIDFTSIYFSTVYSLSNSGDLSNNNPKIPEETNYIEKLITNQVNILSIIEQLKIEFKEISMDEKSQTPITNMIYHLENARNVILNSNSQATFGDVNMTEKAIQDNCTDDVKLLMATINAMKDFCSKFSSTLDIVKIQETVISLESVVESSTIYDNQNQTNFVSTAKFSQNKISKEVALQNLINLETVVEELNSAKPVPEVTIYTKNVSEEKIGIATEGEELIITETVHEEPIESETVPQIIKNCSATFKTVNLLQKVNNLSHQTRPPKISRAQAYNVTNQIQNNSPQPIFVHSDNFNQVEQSSDRTEHDYPSANEHQIQIEQVTATLELNQIKPIIDTKPDPDESICPLLVVGVIIVFGFAIGFNILRNKLYN